MSFADVARRLVGRGISIVPVIPGGKAPGSYDGAHWHRRKGWNEFKTRLPTDEELATWSRWPEPGICVLTGALSKIVAIDLDSREELHPIILSFLPESPVRKRGSKGQTLFYRHTGLAARTTWAIQTVIVCELLTEWPTIIPPSIHPTGEIYQWLSTETLLTLGAESLPAIPEDFIDRMNCLFDGLDPSRRRRAAPLSLERPTPEGTELARVEEALRFIDPGLPYLDWVRIGMAIHSSFPGPDGLGLWDRWSRGSEKYAKNAPHEVEAKWRSFKPGGGVTVATLFQMAKKGGFRPPPRFADELPPANAAPLLASRNGSHEKAPPQRLPAFTLPRRVVDEAPGLVGEIAAWLTSVTRYKQPSYSLAAALSFVGMVKGHRYRTEEDNRTNLLTVAVGSSTSGKSGPATCLKKLADAAGLSARLFGEPSSGPGLLAALHDCGSKGWLYWDEMGAAFKGILSRGAPHYKYSILVEMLKLYSSATTTYVGMQYAGHHRTKAPRIDLHEPCFCLYGTTTPEGIFNAFTSAEAINGFAARLLIFETHGEIAERQRVGIVTVPSALTAKVRAVAGEDNDFEAALQAGDLARYRVPIARVIPYTPQARSLMEETERRFEEVKNRAVRLRLHADEAIWGRAYEHAAKLALTVEDGEQIQEASCQWAIELVEALCRNMSLVASERIADNETHAEVNDLLRLIKSAYPDWVSTNELYSKTRRMARRIRAEHLRALEEEGVIELREDTTGGKPARFYRYIP